MLKNSSIRAKLTAMVIMLVLITIIAAGYISYSIRVNLVEESFLKNLNALADLKVETIQTFVDQSKRDIDLIRNLDALQSEESANVDNSVDTATVAEGFDFDMSGMDMIAEMEVQSDEDVTKLLRALRSSIGAAEILITDQEGNIQKTTNQDSELVNIREAVDGYDESIAPGAIQGVFFSRVFKEEDTFYTMIGAPIKNVSGEVTGLSFIKKDLESVYQILDKNLNIGETVETVLAKETGERAVILNPTLFYPDAALIKGVTFGGDIGGAIQEASQGNEGLGYATDYRSVEVLAVWKHIEDLNWGLIVKIDMSEVKTQGYVVLRKFAIYGSIILIFAIFISILFSQNFIAPLLSLRNSFLSLAQGILPDKIEKKNNDEVGDMAETADNLVQALKRTASFAERIGKGELNAEFKPMSDDDLLGNSLLEMRKNLLDTEEQDKERNWIVTGVAEISDILRTHNTIDALGDAVIAFISEKIEAIQGAFYVVNDEIEDEVFIELNSTYAYHKKKYLKGKFKFAEGLVGQAAIEQATIMRTEVPYDYVSITSGILGDQRPECILITPLMAEEKVYGVLEFAGFRKFDEGQVKFVEEISLILARTIFNIKVNERTRNLLEESQKMSNELQEQQEVLRQNAEEMAATQEELKRTNQRLEDQIEEVNRTQNRMQLLLENASEVIAIYEEEGTIRYISPSVERILGYAQNDLIGINDKIHVHQDGLEDFEDIFRFVIENPFESITRQYEYIKKDGEAVWLEATANNMLSDPAIQGIILNSRDITERRRAEREERMRSKMQALSENSPDLITRLTDEGEFFYINPMIETYTGHKPSDFLNKNLEEVQIEEGIRNEWIRLLKEVEEKNEKVAREMDFPSQLGERVMQVNAIPEFDEDNKMESVLVVSHDITDRKQIELEIQSKNRKITESINYAKRIQGAILPNNVVIRQILPDSFILYKARDVVSGDFPWFINVGDTIYFAAVDCTGHGVPGALISLIGYFLLNDIVRSRKIDDPGKILDALDRGVTKTLRQDGEDASTKDGMDIALCKIDLNSSEVQYAGAHRPLYIVRDGELEEIKGNKWPIGGGIFKNQTKFSSHQIKVIKGDSIFFCSDGFPDQFGGPDNRKFGPKRLRELISDNHDKSMTELYKLFDDQWTDWKGTQKQTDDVLLIGVRF